MVNRNIFKTGGVVVAPANAVNEAGGLAYKFTDAHALCQYIVTGTFNGVYYATAEQQLATIKDLTSKVDSELLAKAAVYGHEVAGMKDIPSYILAVLAARHEIALLRRVFPRVITNFKMLANFVQIVRSGATGRRSFGTAVRNLIREWLVSKDANGLFRMSVGHANPSFADVVKMVHPRPSNKEQEALFA
jgi:60 kDa SS-A/Ro ribonucleoprotein